MCSFTCKLQQNPKRINDRQCPYMHDAWWVNKTLTYICTSNECCPLPSICRELPNSHVNDVLKTLSMSAGQHYTTRHCKYRYFFNTEQTLIGEALPIKNGDGFLRIRSRKVCIYARCAKRGAESPPSHRSGTCSPPTSGGLRRMPPPCHRCR